MDAITVLEPSSLAFVDTQSMEYNAAAVYLAGLKPSGRRSMRQVLDVVAGLLSGGKQDALSLDWSRLRFQHIAAVRSKLVERYKPATVNKTLCGIRGTMKAAWRLGLIGAEDYQKAADIESVNGDTLPAGRELSAGELSALFDACSQDQGPAGVRDGALVALLYAAGLRREEVVTLDLASYNIEDGCLIVFGKRSKERKAYLTGGAAAAMEDWIDLRGTEPGPLFLPINKAGVILLKRLTTQAIYNILRKRADQGKVAHFSPHDLRRTFVSDLLEAGADIATVAKMAGHASVTTTARYDRRPEEAKRKAAGLLHVPYSRRKASM